MPLPHSLRALNHRGLRLFFFGQGVSLLGTWMQSVAQGWLVYRLWGDAALLGWVGFFGQVPNLFLGAVAGTLADAVPRRRMLLVTQSLAMLQATLLCVVVATGRETPALMFGLACLLGLCNAFDIPTRQAFLTDLAGEDLPNAIAFNSALVNGARLVGPAVGGWVVATLGEQWCFGLNALSFLAVLGALLAQEDVQGQGRQRRAPGALQEGLRYAWETPHVRRLLALVAVTSLTATSYTVLMPAFARDVFHGDASTQGHLLGAGGLGAFLGAALLLRREGTLGLEVRVAWGSTLFALGLLLLSRAQTEWQACLVLIPVGLGFMSQMASTNTLLQAHAPPALRGRVMGLFSTLFVGVQPLGALVLGHLARAWGPQAAVGLGASCLLVASLWFHRHRPALPVPAGG